LGIATLGPNNITVESHSTGFAFGSNSTTAGSAAQLSFSHLGDIVINGLIEFDFPPGFVAQSAGDTFSLPDSLVMNVTPLSIAPAPGAPEPGTWVLAAAGITILLRRKKK
jgi:hypothetical protein